MTMVQTKEKQNPKKIGEHYATLKNSLPNIIQKKYFLICESCFWMASTLSYFKSINNLSFIYRECPTCENKINKFTIPPDSN